MATKKKKGPIKKAVRKKAPRRRAAAPAAAAAPAVQTAPRRNGLWLALLILGLLLAVIWRGQRKFASHDEPAGQVPEGRSPAASVDPGSGPASAPPAQPTARREAAGETGEPSLTFDRGEQDALSVRCWRPADGQARLDIFGPRNQRVRTLTSESGEAGWQSLRWDGKDEQGRPVPVGLYFVRPSAQDLQQVRDVWVKG